METCHFCHALVENPRLVFCDGREGVPTCAPPCDAALRPMPVARASKSCTSCGADVTNQETYNGGDCFFCLPEDQKVLVAGDPIVRWIGSLAS